MQSKDDDDNNGKKGPTYEQQKKRIAPQFVVPKTLGNTWIDTPPPLARNTWVAAAAAYMTHDLM